MKKILEGRVPYDIWREIWETKKGEWIVIDLISHPQPWSGSAKAGYYACEGKIKEVFWGKPKELFKLDSLGRPRNFTTVSFYTEKKRSKDQICRRNKQIRDLRRSLTAKK